MPWGIVDVECAYCLRVFTPKLNGPTPRTCSGACRQALHRRERGTAGRPSRHRRTTAERREVARRELAARLSPANDVGTRHTRSTVTSSRPGEPARRRAPA